MSLYIPFKHLEFDSDYSAGKIQQIVRNSITPITWIPVIPSPKPFRGRIKDRGFFVIRAIDYKNSWRPVAYGTLIEGNGQTRVKINICWAYLVLIFTTIMYGGWLLAFYFILCPVFGVNFVFVLFGFVVIYALTMIDFNAEAKGLEEFLLPLLRSRESALPDEQRGR